MASSYLAKILLVLVSSQLYILGKGECENACSGHGRCTLYDMCICYRNWQSNDCSESKWAPPSHLTAVHYKCLIILLFFA
jgi:hypothetical protein